MKKDQAVRNEGDGFFECVWMRAGVVDFKLCDRYYECESCPLDEGIRQSGREHRVTAPGASRAGAREPRREDGLTRVHGYAVSNTLFYHPRHVWVRVEEAGRVRLGLDDFGQRLTGRVYAVSLPSPGTLVGPGSLDWRVIHRAGETPLTIPVAGVVEEVNERLSLQPSLVNREPYRGGAALVIRPNDLVGDLKGLHYGRQVERWFEDETETLHSELLGLLQQHTPALGRTLPDGGVHIEDLSVEIGVQELQRLIDRFLSVSVGPVSGEPIERRK